MSKYVESPARTNKLHCSMCHNKIKKGDLVVFELYNGRMENAYCENCGELFTNQLIEDSEHPFSSEGLGQE